MKIILFAIGIVVLLAEFSTQNSCDHNNVVNGCSIPFNLPFRYKYTFKSVCNRHDICYRCGYSNRLKRRKCDRRFYRRMLAICSRQRRRQRRCRKYARIYYFAVRVGGSWNYSKYTVHGCRATWVRRCL